MDIESDLVYVNSVRNKENYQSMELFLSKYEKNKKNNFTAAHGKKYTYNYEDIIKNSPCSREKHYGYLTTGKNTNHTTHINRDLSIIFGCCFCF